MSMADDRRVAEVLDSEQARAWQARLTAAFFDQAAKRDVIAEIRADLAGRGQEKLGDTVIEHLCRLASRDARRPEPAAAPAAPLLSGYLLEDAIRDEYPFPIAAPHHALTEQRNDASRFLCLMDTYEGLVHFLATVAVSAYLRTDLASAECNRLLLDLLRKRGWSTGDYFALLTGTVRLAGDCGGRLPYPELPGHLFTPAGKPTAAHEVLASFIHLRNRRLGHGTGRTEAACAEVVPPNRQRLEEELARMPWLAGWRLIRPVDIDDTGRVTSADLLNGCLPRNARPFALQLRKEDWGGPDGTVRADKDTLLLVAPDGRAYLPLFPLALFRFQPRGGAYLLEGCRWQAEEAGGWRLERAAYRAYQEGLPGLEEGQGELAALMLERLVARLRAGLPEGEAAAVPAAPPAEDPDCEVPQVGVEQEAHRREFVGREEMLAGLAGWIDGKAEGGYLLLLGPPGQGKSALMAELAHREARPERGGCLLHMVKSRRNPLRFLPALIRQAARLAGTSFGADAYRGDVVDLRNNLVRALEAVRDRVGRAVVVVDALDELDAAGERVTFLPPAVPPGVRVVLTCRPDIPLVMALRARLRGLEERDVPPLSEADFRLVLERRLGAETAAALGRAADLAALFRRLGGNPLFLRYFVDDAARWAEAARQGRAGPLDVAAVPASLDALFHQVYDRVRAAGGADEERGRGRQRARLLQILCLARRPLSVEELSGLLAADGQPLFLEECRDRVEEMSQWLLDTGGGRFQPWHQGLTDYVRDRVLGQAGCRQTEEVFCRWLERPLPETVAYGLRHRPEHLLAAGQLDAVCDLLTDLRFLEAKAEAGLVFHLAGDFSRAVGRLPQDHPRRRILDLLEQALKADLNFLGRHPGCLFPFLWNSGWWYDCPQAARYYDPPPGGWSAAGPPWERPGERLYTLLESWRSVKERAEPGFVWLRFLRPPAVHLGTAQRAIFRGHEDGVRAVAFAPDGSRLASGSKDGTVRVWDAAVGHELACLRGHQRTVTSVAFAPDGGRLASGSYDGTVRLWDVAGGHQLACLRGHKYGVLSVAFAPDGARLASASEDGTVRLWDAAGGHQLACLRGYGGGVRSMALAPDGRRLASGSEDGTVRLWDAAAGHELACLRGHGGRVTSVAFAPDGGRLASGSLARTGRLWDAVAGQELARLRGHESAVESVVFAPDGARLASGSWDGTVRLWDAAAGHELACLRGHGGRVTSVAFAPDGGRLASGSLDQTVRLWDAAGGQELACLRGHEGPVDSVVFSPDGRRLASRSSDGTVRVWDARNGACIEILAGSGDLAAIAAGLPAFLWRALSRKLGTVIEDAAISSVVAWFPAAVGHITTHPSGRSWAGAVRNHVCLFTLEVTPSAQPPLSRKPSPS